MLLIVVADFEDFEPQRAFGYLDFHLIADFLSQQALADGAPLVVESASHRRGLFENRHADAAIDALDADLHVVFGGPVETDLRGAVMGLLARGKKVAIVSDGIAFLDGERASSHLAAMAAEGCGFVSLGGALGLS